MKLKTFVLTYLLFLGILFSSIGIVSVYLTNSQIHMLKEKSIREYQIISAALAKDIAVLFGRRADPSGSGFAESVQTLVRGYARYYERYDITISVMDQSLPGQTIDSRRDTEIMVIEPSQEQYIYISANLPEPFSYFRLEYYANIAISVAEMRRIQRNFLLFSVAFSIVTAFSLYSILTSVFRPLGVVAGTARKIADGQYGERVQVRGKNELSALAGDFNRMAEVIEKQIRLLEEESISKQQFIDNFSHEIRTPLTSIYGYAEYLQKAPASDRETYESTQFIMEEAAHMRKIADSLLELATLRNDQPVKKEIKLQPLFEHIEMTLKKPMADKGARLVWKNSVDVLLGQEDLVKSLLMNLCYNALKACPQEEGVICLEAEECNGDTVLSVSDNGCGISEEHITRVTEPFYRVDKARSREHGGTGLGLTLCKQIAEAHGAELRITSSAGAGTAVAVIFTAS